MQVSHDESKSGEMSKLQKALESLKLELDAAKLTTINECNKNAVLQNQLELSEKGKSALEREIIGMAELRKENAFLKVGLVFLIDFFHSSYFSGFHFFRPVFCISLSSEISHIETKVILLELFKFFRDMYKKSWHKLMV